MAGGQYSVYILANIPRTLYVGVTNDLERRLVEHREGNTPGFTSHYRIDRLVYYEVTDDVQAAIAREKQIKGWLRSKKVALIESHNPNWSDLSLSRLEILIQLNAAWRRWGGGPSLDAQGDTVRLGALPR